MKLTPMEYILIDIANSAGFDKLSYKLRLIEAKNIIDSIENDSQSVESVCSECKEDPFQLRKAIVAYFNEDLDHIIGLDAVNQALQLYGVLTGDLATSSLASLGIDERTDAYQLLADELNRAIGTDIFNRDNCKKALMITLYGSTMAYKKVLDHMKVSSQMDLGLACGLATGTYESDWFEGEFKRAMEIVAPKAVEAMNTIQELNDESIGTYRWTMYDNFKVKYDVKSNQDVEVKATSRGGINFTYTTKCKVYQASKFNRGMSPNIIHSVDGYVARQMIRRMNGKFIVTIHDEFKCKARDCAEMQNNYKLIMCELLDSDLLNDIIREINPNASLIFKQNTLTKELIMESSYAIS